MEQQQQQQRQYENTGNVRGGGLRIQQRIKNSLPLIIRILAYVQGGLSLLIFAMEIGIIVCYFLYASATTSTTAASLIGPLTAAGIWTSIVMDIAILFLFRLVKQINEQRMWMINAGTQCILLLFTIILIGITGNYVDKNRAVPTYCSSINLYEGSKYQCTKYQLHQAQLAFAILMLFSAILFIGLFLYLYFVVRSFSSPVITPVYISNNNANPGIHQYGSWQQAPPLPLSPNNATSMARPSVSVLREIECPHCHTTLPLPMPKETFISTE